MSNEKFKLSEDGKILYKYLGSYDEVIEIPSSVEIINSFAINQPNTQGAKKVILNEGLKIIEREAICFAKNTKVKIPSSVEKIYSTSCCYTYKGEYIRNCELVFDEANPRFFTDGKGVYEILEDGYKLVYVYKYEIYELLENTKVIGEEAFNNCENIDEYEIPASVVKIEKNAFKHINIETLKIPSSTIDIDESNFEHWFESFVDDYEQFTTTINVDPNNPKYYSDDTAFYFKDGDNLILQNFYYKKRKEIELNEKVTEIGKFAFNNLSKVTKVILPKRVHTLHGGSFYNCHNLKLLEMEGHINFIGTYLNTLDEFNIDEIIFHEDCDRDLSFAEKKYKGYKPFMLHEDVIFYDEFSSKTKIICNPGTRAERYAKLREYKIKYLNEIDHKADHTADFEIKKDKTSVSIEKYVGDKTEVCIPDEIDGLPVLKIKKTAFAKNKLIKKIILPKGLKKLAADTFMECVELKEIILPHGLEEIGEGCFKSCLSLNKITIPETVTRIGPRAFLYHTTGFSYYEHEYRIILKTIIGKTNSYAEQYAAINGIEFISNGTIEPRIEYSFYKQYEYDKKDGHIRLKSVLINTDLEYFDTFEIPNEIDGEIIEELSPNFCVKTNINNYDASNESTVVLNKDLKYFSINRRHGSDERKYDFTKCKYLISDGHAIYTDGGRVLQEIYCLEKNKDEKIETSYGTYHAKYKILDGTEVLEDNSLYIDYIAKYMIEVPDSLRSFTPVGAYDKYHHAFLGSNQSIILELANAYEGVAVYTDETPHRIINVYENNLEAKRKAEEEEKLRIAATQTKIDGVIYTKDLKTLVKYEKDDMETEFIIPDHVEYLEPEAFEKSLYLQRVVFNDKIAIVPYELFSGCTKLSEVKLGQNISEIQRYAFEKTAIESIELPKSIKKVHRDSLGKCKQITFYEDSLDQTNPFNWIDTFKEETLFIALDNNTDKIKYKLPFMITKESYYTALDFRNATTDGKPDFDELDELFDKITYFNFRAKYALYRVLYKYNLSAEMEEKYFSYLNRIATKLYSLLIDEDDVDMIKELEPYKLLKKTNIIKVIEYAQSVNKPDLVMYFMSLKNTL